MSSKRPPVTPSPPPNRSGEHQLVIDTVRRRFKSIDERTIPAMLEAEKRLETEVSESSPPKNIMMGDWVILIRGKGPHHNAQPGDANRIAGAFRRELTDAGHTIVEASFRNGIEEEIKSEGEPTS